MDSRRSSDVAVRKLVNFTRRFQARMGVEAADAVLTLSAGGHVMCDHMGRSFYHEFASECLLLDISSPEAALEGAQQGLCEAQRALRDLHVPHANREVLADLLSPIIVHHVLLGIERQLRLMGWHGTIDQVLGFVREFDKRELAFRHLFAAYWRGVLDPEAFEFVLTSLLEHTFKRGWPQRRFGWSVDRVRAERVVLETLRELREALQRVNRTSDQYWEALICIWGTHLLRDRALSLAEGFDCGRRLAG